MTRNSRTNRTASAELLLPLVCASALTMSTGGAIVGYTNQAEWETLSPSHTFIDFLGWDSGTLISDQYAELGVTFVQGGEFAWNNWTNFPLDGAGLSGGWQGFYPLPIVAQFEGPRTSVGVHFQGGMQFTLFLGEMEVGKSQIFSAVYTGNFAGIVSSVPFDKVVIVHPGTGVSLIDNLFFGAAIPVPAPLALYALLGMSAGRRRRS